VQAELTGVAGGADRKTRASEERLSELKAIIEKQDQLIAALWVKTYGYRPGEGGYVGEKYIPSSTEPLNEAWGIRPPWRVDLDYVGDEFTKLTRNANYPWGMAGSLHLTRPDLGHD
jgi:hypothetical protein